MTALPLKDNLLLVGAGKMGGALLEGWLRQGLDPAKIMICDPTPPPATQTLIDRHRLALNPDLSECSLIEIIIIAIKPQLMSQVLPQIAEIKHHQPLVISIAAGTKIAAFANHFGPQTAIIRSIPNTPAAIGRGITAIAVNPYVSAGQKHLAAALLQSIGEVIEVDDEALIDAVTAVSGSGPAYLFYLTECLAAAAEDAGLPAQAAKQLARATIAGAGELMHQTGIDASQLRENVTSPNGTTDAALQVLMAQDGLKPLISKAVQAAAKRSRELAG